MWQMICCRSNGSKGSMLSVEAFGIRRLLGCCRAEALLPIFFPLLCLRVAVKFRGTVAKTVAVNFLGLILVGPKGTENFNFLPLDLSLFFFPFSMATNERGTSNVFLSQM